MTENTMTSAFASTYAREFRASVESSEALDELISTTTLVADDEAFENQEIFTNISPKHPKFNGGFKASLCPRGYTAQVSTRSRRKEQQKSYTKIPHKISVKSDGKFKEVTQSNILALLSRNTPKKCLECNSVKCECVISDEVNNIVNNSIKKGRIMIENIKTQKKNKPKIVVSKPEKTVFRKRKSAFSRITQILNSVSKPKDPNIVEGTSIMLRSKSKKHSA